MMLKIKKSTIIRFLNIRDYQKFLEEWLQLYDTYMAVNPLDEKQLQANCLFALINALLNKEFYFLEENNLSKSDMYCMLHDYITRISNDGEPR